MPPPMPEQIYTRKDGKVMNIIILVLDIIVVFYPFLRLTLSKWRFLLIVFLSISSETPCAPRKILANQKYCKPALVQQRDPQSAPLFAVAKAPPMSCGRQVNILTILTVLRTLFQLSNILGVRTILNLLYFYGVAVDVLAFCS